MKLYGLYMIEIKTKLRKWGNSYGIVVPIKFMQKEKMKEGDAITILLKKEKRLTC